jgi:hypothetical protein
MAKIGGHTDGTLAREQWTCGEKNLGAFRQYHAHLAMILLGVPQVGRPEAEASGYARQGRHTQRVPGLPARLHTQAMFR